MKSKASPLPRPLRKHYYEDVPKNHSSKPKRQFFVEQHRKQIDEYMLGQIKKNKKSVKLIKKQIDDLRTQMNQLQSNSKTQRCEYDMLCLKVNQLKRDKSEPKLDATTKRHFPLSKSKECLHQTRRQFVGSKQSSQTSRRSSRIVQPVRSKCVSSGKNGMLKSNSCNKDESSKVLLKKKIQNLKEKAQIIRQSAEEIQNQISRKIDRKIEQSHRQQNIESHPSQGYQELMELLRTNKRIDEPQLPHPGPKAVTEAHSQKSIVSTNREGNNLRNSTISYYVVGPKETPKPPSSSELASQTNLLQSNKNIVTLRPKLQLSQCLNIQVLAEQKQQQFEQMLERSQGISGGDLSFEDQQGKEKQLKELEFQFDQLVRQQLMSNDTNEKVALGQNIRSLLTKIGQLRQELHQQSL